MNQISSKGMRAIALIIVAIFVVSGIPSVIFNAPVTQNASAAEYYVKVGMLQDLSNWNPLKIEFVSEYVTTYLMYSVLFQYTEDWEGPVNDLATEYYMVNHPSGNMTMYVNITHNAYFRNNVNIGDTSHHLTAEDVAFTINLIRDNPGGAWDVYVQDITGANATSTYQVALDVKFPKATMLDDLVWVPILPKYIWDTEPNPLGAKKPAFLVGSGPFVYNSSLKTQWYRFTRAPNYHGSTDYPVGDPRGDRVVNVDGVVYRFYSDVNLMVSAMNAGELDAMDISGAPSSFITSVSNSFTKMVTQEMAIIDIAINAIPLEFRETKGGGYGQGNPLLLDKYVREAIMMTLNKDYIRNTLMYGLPTVAYSVLSPSYWQADIQGKLFYNTTAAKDLLLAHGYADSDSDGYLEATSTAASVTDYGVPVGTQLTLKVQAPDTDPSYKAIGEAWVGWARDAGIMFDYSTDSEAIITNNAWYKANYDIWVWSWYWSPEPLSNLGVWQTSQMTSGGDNCQGPMGPWYAINSTTGKPYSAFDENCTAAQREFDPAARKVLVDKLQQWIYDSRTESPPIYPAGLYVVSNARYTGWGNWTEHLGRSTSSDLLWVWFDLVSKGGNQMPEFQLPLDTQYSFIVNETQSFTVTVSDPDGDQVNITWNFGDGTTATNDSGALATLNGVTFVQTHVYHALALPPNGLDMNVTANDGTPANTATSYATVNVFPYPDALPEPTVPILSDPIDKAYVGQNVTWTAGALDLETGGGFGTGLVFTWAWDDGTSTSTSYMPTVKGGEAIDVQVHNWSLEGSYNVELFVDDGSAWPGHNVSMGQFAYEIVLNQPPTAPDISTIDGLRNLWMDCIATASDVDGDSLKFTWLWNDGTFNVTVSPASQPGATIVSEVMHRWTAQGAYVVNVSVDDQTGEIGHNVSAEIAANIVNSGQVPPCSIALLPTPNPAYPDHDVSFNASAVDANGDALTYYLEYGDGNASVNTSAGGVTTRQQVGFVHAYEATGDYTATVWVDDGTGNVSKSIVVTVKENSPPWLILRTNASAYYNRTFNLLPSRVRDNDSDPLSVWFAWGDDTGSASAGPFHTGTHVYEMVGEVNVTVFADDGTGLPGHNVSRTVTVVINDNFRPTIEGTIGLTPSKTQYKAGETVMFTVTVKDYEGDMVNVTVDFGDGTTPTAVPSFRPGANNLTTVYVNHTFEKGRSTPYSVVFTVDDGMMAYHSIKTWNTRIIEVSVEKKPVSSALYIGIGVGVIAILALLIAFMLMRRKKEPKDQGGMEGMKAPIEEPEAPPKT
ncbi:MAG: ABC transporter substrate-binding protein [Euryarchaeota archaeon]|nr:ABC transporter substrate-binding protein [Euryarchaeota archaeon]